MVDDDIDIEFYSELSGKKLSEDEAREARDNLVGFFDLLLQIDNRNKKKDE